MAAAILQLSSWFLLLLYIAYLLLYFISLYAYYFPFPCPFYASQCLENYVTKTPYPQLKLWVYSSASQSPNGSDLYPVWELDDFRANESFTKDVTVRIPLLVHNNGTMFLHVFLTPVEEGGGRGEWNPFEADWVVHRTGKLTYISHQTSLQVNSGGPKEKQDMVSGDHRHWRSRLTLNVVTTDVKFNSRDIPKDVTNYILPYDDQYLPVLVIDEMNYRTKDLLPLNKSCKEMPLTISYTPVSFGTFRLRMGVVYTEVNGTSEREVEDHLKEAFNNELPKLLLTDILLMLYVLFELFAIERDISFWQERKTMAGLSTQAVVWRCVCFVVILLYVLDQQSGRTDLVAYSIFSVVEIWKVMRVFKARISWTEWRLVFDVPNAAVSDKERETQELDSQAMKCLSYALYPLWVAVFIYNLIYYFHMSWYSLCIQSLVTGFYCFGFIFTLPQVFINYKLKSVADLPWKAWLVRAVGYYILDIRIFTATIPLSSFEFNTMEEVIFVIYLYQRWLYNN